VLTFLFNLFRSFINYCT